MSSCADLSLEDLYRILSTHNMDHVEHNACVLSEFSCRFVLIVFPCRKAAQAVLACDQYYVCYHMRIVQPEKLSALRMFGSSVNFRPEPFMGMIAQIAHVYYRDFQWYQGFGPACKFVIFPARVLQLRNVAGGVQKLIPCKAPRSLYQG